MATYQEFSRQIKEKYPEYKDVDDLKLANAMIEKYPEYKNQVTFDDVQEQPQEPIKAGISVDVTPSGLFKGSQNVVGSAIAAPFIAKRDNISVQDAFNQNMDKAREWRKENPTPAQDFLVDTAAYSLIPVSRAAGLPGVASNIVRFGAIPGALEGLKNGIGNSVKGALGGSAIAGGIMAGLPVIGNVAKQISKPIKEYAGRSLAKTFQLDPETVEQAIKPTSKALDYTKNTIKQKEGQLVENIRNAYNQVLVDKGNQVGQLLSDLPEGAQMKAGDLLQDYDKIFNNYSLSKNPALNPARNATTKEMTKIEGLLGGNMPELAIGENRITPKELYDINKNISNMVDWDKPGAALKNEVLEQIYGTNAEKIANLSPELKEANKAYSDLMDFQKSEGIRAILNPNNTDNAISKLKNYDTMSSVQKNQNIRELENKLVKEGYSPFLSDVDDIVAAQDLLKTDRGGLGGLTGFLKEAMLRPTLQGARKINQTNLPAILQNIGNIAGDVSRRVLPASLIAPWQ